MSTNAPIPVQSPGGGQMVAPGAGVRLAELAVGQAYRVTVTDVYPGKAEILIGNQYLLAATPFSFQPGDVLTLRLTDKSPELLRFQLALPPGQSAEAETAADVATILRAAAVPDTPSNRSALILLLRNGVPVTGRSLGEAAQLLSNLPPEAVAAFAPLYKELLEKRLSPGYPVLEQLARLAGGPPQLAAMLAGIAEELRRETAAKGARRKSLEDAVEAALLALDEEEEPPTGALLKEQLRLLYGSPEQELAGALLRQSPAEDETESQERGTEITLSDLENVVAGEELPPGLADVLAALMAQRIVSSLREGRLSLALPLALDGEPAELSLSLQMLAEQYYQKDYALRLRVETGLQGAVEFQVITRGPGLNLDVLVSNPAVAPLYEAELPALRDELARTSGFLVRRLEVSPQTL